MAKEINLKKIEFAENTINRVMGGKDNYRNRKYKTKKEKERVYFKNEMSESEKIKRLEYCKGILSSFDIYFDNKDILGKSRKANLNFIRSCIAVILRQEGLSFVKIGSVMNRDHATAINLLKYDTKKQARDPRFNEVKKHVTDKNVTFEKIKLYIKEIEVALFNLKRALVVFKS